MLGDITITLRAVIGSARSTVGDACGLAIGRCVLLDAAPDHLVALTVGDRQVARAEVSVNQQRVAVRVAALAG